MSHLGRSGTWTDERYAEILGSLEGLKQSLLGFFFLRAAF